MLDINIKTIVQERNCLFCLGDFKKAYCKEFPVTVIIVSSVNMKQERKCLDKLNKWYQKLTLFLVQNRYFEMNNKLYF